MDVVIPLGVEQIFCEEDGAVRGDAHALMSGLVALVAGERVHHFPLGRHDVGDALGRHQDVAVLQRQQVVQPHT